MRKILTVAILLIFTMMTIGHDAYALWGMGTQSKLGKEAYERLIKKNLELKEEVDSLVKAQEQLKDVYRLLLEKIKVFQRDNSLLMKDKETADAAEAERKQTIANLDKEIVSANGKISAMEELLGKTGTAIKAGTDVYYEKNILSLKNSLASSEQKYKEAIKEKQELEKKLKNILTFPLWGVRVF